MNYLKQLFFILFSLISTWQILCCNLIFANTFSKPEPKDMMEAHLKCNIDLFSKYNWLDSSGINQFSKYRVIIVNNVFVTNLTFMPSGTKDDDGEEWGQKHNELDQYYRLSYRYFHSVSCDRNDLDFIKKYYSKEKLGKEKIEDDFQDDDYFIRYKKEGVFTIERDGNYEYRYSIFPGIIQKETAIDKSKSGLICMIQIEDFIKDQNVISIDKLCEGQSQSKKDLMKWAIDNLHAFYKSKYGEWKKTAKPDRK
ncbi:MAG: hypothetical protein HQK50_13555 [Oligoflexia bacterium]|nr:hypothetical protein [Oligoflexia bacterium]